MKPRFPRRLAVHLFLASLVLAGFVHTSGAQMQAFHFDQGCASEEATLPPFLEADCEGLRQHFQQNPIPIGAVDVEVGKEIVGYRILCHEMPVGGGGQMGGGGPERVIPRSWGTIQVKYAP